MDWSLPEWKKPKRPINIPKPDVEKRRAAQLGGLAKAQQTRRRRQAEKIRNKRAIENEEKLKKQIEENGVIEPEIYEDPEEDGGLPGERNDGADG